MISSSFIEQIIMHYFYHFRYTIKEQYTMFCNNMFSCCFVTPVKTCSFNSNKNIQKQLSQGCSSKSFAAEVVILSL